MQKDFDFFVTFGCPTDQCKQRLLALCHIGLVKTMEDIQSTTPI